MMKYIMKNIERITGLYHRLIRSNLCLLHLSLLNISEQEFCSDTLVGLNAHQYDLTYTAAKLKDFI